MNGSNWQIDTACPQCGAPVLLDEADHIIACSFCRTRLYLETDALPCYYLPPPPDLGEEVLYLPYRRMRGMAFNIAGGEVNARYVDGNTRAVTMAGLPMTIGVRPQAMKLRFLTAATGGSFVPPDDNDHRGTKPGSAPPIRPTFPEVFIGETVSIIYNPFYRQGDNLYDAFLRRPIAAFPDNLADLTTAVHDQATVRFLALQCPQCGWDLEGEKTTLVLTCGNCLSAWSGQDGALRAVPFALWEGTRDAALYLPFWRLKAGVMGVRLSSLADFVRLANLPRAVTAAMESQTLYFWIPAFKITPSLFLRWARQMTVFQPAGDFSTAIAGKSLYPVTLPPGEALETVFVTLAAVMMDKRALQHILREIRLQLQESLLVYHPFVRRNRELLHEKMGVTMDSNALGFGKQL